MTSEILCFAIALCECALWKLLHNLAVKLASQNNELGRVRKESLLILASCYALRRRRQ